MARERFKHLTFTDRLRIEAGLKMKLSMKQIADSIGVHVSTVYREIKRGTYMKKKGYWDHYGYEKRYRYKETYSPDIAEQKYRECLKAKGAPLTIGKDHALAEYLEKKIVDEKLTVSAALGEIKRKQLPFHTSICVRTLYSYIEKGVFLRLTLKRLPFQGRRIRHNRKLCPARPPRGESIEKRPACIAERSEFGHWEMDCVKGVKDSRYALLVLTERVTRHELIFRIPDLTTKTIVQKVDGLERRFGRSFRAVFKSITVDNGSEFSDSVGLERSCLRKGKRTHLYYCHPYSAYERGSNERMNREIRRRFPKGINFDHVSAKRISELETWLNNYPRGVLDFDTPAERFAEELKKLS